MAIKIIKLIIPLFFLCLNAHLVLAACTAPVPNDCEAKYGISGYSCMAISKGKDCLPCHCSGGESTQCCKPLEESSTAAGGAEASGVLPKPEGGGEGDYSLNDIVRTAIKGSKIVLGMVGSLALLAFICGGVMFLISGGSSEKVEKGKQIIIGAVIGLIVVFTSYMIIQFTMDALGIEKAGGGKWSTSGWFSANQ